MQLSLMVICASAKRLSTITIEREDYRSKKSLVDIFGVRYTAVTRQKKNVVRAHFKKPLEKKIDV